MTRKMRFKLRKILGTKKIGCGGTRSGCGVCWLQLVRRHEWSSLWWWGSMRWNYLGYSTTTDDAGEVVAEETCRPRWKSLSMKNASLIGPITWDSTYVFGCQGQHGIEACVLAVAIQERCSHHLSIDDVRFLRMANLQDSLFEMQAGTYIRTPSVDWRKTWLCCLCPLTPY